MSAPARQPSVTHPLVIVVPGLPIAQGSKRLVRGRMIESAKLLKPWRRTVTLLARQAMQVGNVAPLTGGVAMTCVFRFPRGKTVHRRVPAIRPDLDKLTRAIFDALGDASVYFNDAQVCHVTATKWYADDTREAPGVTITVEAWP